MKIEVARADELGEGYRHRVAEVLTQGFAEDFAFFSKDPGVLADAFAPMLRLRTTPRIPRLARGGMAYRPEARA